jgi:activating signal cointegrator complex subunit 1
MIELPEPVLVDFGTWDVDELQICKVLDDGPRGEYVCVEKISLV